MPMNMNRLIPVIFFRDPQLFVALNFRHFFKTHTLTHTGTGATTPDRAAALARAVTIADRAAALQKAALGPAEAKAVLRSLTNLRD